ncbi:MAG: AMP-binding protein [Lacisediminihabitans sp.]
MTHALRVVAPAEPWAMLAALRDALSGDGPAVLPHPGAPGGLPAVVPRRVALVIETSGSTGKPKRVALSADALLSSAAASQTALGGPGQWLLALPAHYIAGANVLVRSLASGTTPVMLPEGHFDPREFAELSRTMEAPLRFASLVPAQLVRLVDAAEQDPVVLELLRRFDRLLVGGQATPAALLVRSLELGLKVTRTYGSSETSGGCVYDGLPLAGVDARIVGGQVELGGSTLAEGYLGDEELTDAAFHTEQGRRWYRTGDAGELTDGVLQVTGRMDGVIISGGVKVLLAEVERIVTAIPGLADAVVVSVPSPEWGEVPVVISTRSGNLEDVRSTVAAALGKSARPAALLLVDSIPLLSSGKPDRLALGSLAAARPAAQRSAQQ